MGGGYVAQALTHWRPRLPDQPMIVLVHMANVAKDTVHPPRYWRGREAIARFGLGREMPPDPDHKDDCKCLVCAERRAINRAVMRNIKYLVDAGAIIRVRSGRTGLTAEYELVLGPVKSDSDRHPEGDSRSHPEGDSERFSGRQSPSPQGETEEKQTGDRRGETSPEATTSPGSVGDPRAPDQSPQPKLCPHGKPDVWHGINHGCRECRHEGR